MGRPNCPSCSEPMKLRMIVPADDRREHHVFECRECREERTITVAAPK
jgi:transposase-like protein